MFTTPNNRTTERPNATTLDPQIVRAPEPAVEAPDRGEVLAEPLEDAIIRHAEAPDAGDSRADLIDQDYTHGRSMT
ncbi:hypothetical protein [Tautonia rosea]|uniref:hypothetical protein n=1 Tax=Tautonia rosea TaxID=2728037 RepID=UPI0014736809|nr:hypothetical protein [Tautonia rosea]